MPYDRVNLMQVFSESRNFSFVRRVFIRFSYFQIKGQGLISILNFVIYWKGVLDNEQLSIETP